MGTELAAVQSFPPHAVASLRLTDPALRLLGPTALCQLLGDEVGDAVSDGGAVGVVGRTRRWEQESHILGEAREGHIRSPRPLWGSCREWTKAGELAAVSV